MKSFGKQLIKNLSIGFALLLIILTVLLFSGFITEYYSVLFAIIFVNTLIAATLFFFLHIREMSEKERQGSKMIEFVSYMFLLSLVILVVNQFLQRDIITNFQWYIVIISIALGFLSFYAKHDSVERELDAEKAAETKAENERRTEFNDKFPTIARIPVLRNVVRWMYAEGWGYSTGLIGIFILFISIKIGMIIIFQGSYLDEYLHIFSGLNFIETGDFAHFYSNSTTYARGFYVSILSGVASKLFGNSISIQKLVPALVGFVNFFMLYKISSVLERKSSRLLLLLTYSFYPLVIFNQFYLRMYVFYEFFFLIIILSLVRLQESLKESNSNKTKLWLTIGLAFFLFILFNNEVETLLFLVPYGCFLFILFMKNDLTINREKNRWITHLKRLLNLSWIYKISLLIIIALLLALLVLSQKSDIIFNLTIKNGFGEQNKLTNLFFNFNSTLTVFFILGSIHLMFKEDKKTLLGLIGLSLIIIHFILPPEFRVIRGILYFIPLYLLVAFSFLETYKNKKIILIVLLILLNVFSSYQLIMQPSPHIPGEIDYFDFKGAYQYLGESCNAEKIGIIHAPYIAEFYNVKLTGLFYISNPSSDINYVFQEGNYVVVYNHLPLITEREEIDSYLNDKETCFITAKEIRHNRKYVTEADFNSLLQKEEINEFEGLLVITN